MAGGAGQWESVDIKKALQDALVSFADEYKKEKVVYILRKIKN